MNTVLLSVKVDKKTKQDLKDFAAELGVSSTAVVNMVIKQVLRDKQVYLNTTLEPTQYLEGIMREANTNYSTKKDITHTKGKGSTLSHIDSLMK